MPELPEVERVRLSLEPCLVGRWLRAVRISRADVFRSHRGTGLTPRSPRLRRAALLGQRVARLHRHGKQLAIESEEGPTLVVHLGMSGQLLALKPGAAPPDRDHLHVTWSLAGGEGEPAGRLIFRDPRRFGGLWAFGSMDELYEQRWRLLGPDALGIRSTDLGARLRGTRPLKAALLDQAVVAGLGNIYVDEALFRARLHPARAAGSLHDPELNRLAAAVRAVLRESIRAGGTTFRDFRDAAAQTGRYGRSLQVYGRSGRSCLRCANTLARDVLGQRTTVFCPHCQAAD